MNTTRTSNRIAAGVTAAYLRDLSRHPAASPAGGRRAAAHRPATPRAPRGPAARASRAHGSRRRSAHT
jgi:hypothetical protein